MILEWDQFFNRYSIIPFNLWNAVRCWGRILISAVPMVRRLVSWKPVLSPVPFNPHGWVATLYKSLIDWLIEVRAQNMVTPDVLIHASISNSSLCAYCSRRASSDPTVLVMCSTFILSKHNSGCLIYNSLWRRMLTVCQQNPVLWIQSGVHTICKIEAMCIRSTH